MKDQKDKQYRFFFIQPFLIIFTKGVINSDHNCIFRNQCQPRYRSTHKRTSTFL